MQAFLWGDSHLRCAAPRCGKYLPPAKPKGRPQLYCDVACRMVAYRERQKQQHAEAA